jgi:hypothetical protein
MIHPVRMLLNAPIDWEMALEQGQAWKSGHGAW